MRFDTVTDLKKYLRSKGITKISVRTMRNPFVGEDKFAVARLDLPEGTIASSSGSRKSTKWFSDNNEIARKMAELQRALDEVTNAFAVARH